MNIVPEQTPVRKSNDRPDMGFEALELAASGFFVFPLHTIRNGQCSCGNSGCKSTGKHPIAYLAPNGLKNATRDPQTIARWWDQERDANIGIKTGKEAGLVVIDVDGPQGEDQLAALVKAHGQIPPTPQVKTGRGRHDYYSYPTNCERIKSIARNGLDVRADGGYVVAPPSIHANGNRYQWMSDVQTLPDLPDFLISYANGEERAKAKPVASAHQTPADRHAAQERATIEEALNHIPAAERDVWLQMGMALNAMEDKVFARELWDRWSATVPEKFDPIAQDTTWQSFDRPYNRDPITLRTLYATAMQAGWTPPTTGSVEVQGRERHTDLGNARRLVRRHGADIRYVHAWLAWVIWRDCKWVVDRNGEIMRRAKDTVESQFDEIRASDDGDMRDRARKFALASQSAARIEQMVKLATSEASIVLPADAFDKDQWLLGVENGVIDLRSGSFRHAVRGDLLTKSAHVSYDPNAACPNWVEFIDTVTDRNRELAEYLQRTVGYVLTGSVVEEVLFVLFGTGRNGKSTFREVVHTMLGDYAVVADAGLLMARRDPGAASPDVARLRGCRLASINETAQNDVLNEAHVKFLTSNDRITARNLHQAPFDFMPSHKAFLTTNHRPIIKNSDLGIWRRIHLLPFVVTIPEGKVERDFRERRLLPELSGILNWALEGLAEYQKQGLNPPDAVTGATKDYQTDMDLLGQWIEEECETGNAAVTPNADLHRAYKSWAEREVGFDMTAVKFGRELKARGFESKKGTAGRRFVIGLRLRDREPKL